ELCKAIANPRRLELINALREGEKRVNELVAIVGIPKANVSQHLSFLRHKGLVEARKEGVSIYYSLADPRILEACSIMKEVLVGQMKRSSKLFKKVSGRAFFYR
ncbi:MAG: metalloregulator ArsR/SmtB family transcription factor, partial [Nitrospirota bacterium]